MPFPRLTVLVLASCVGALVLPGCGSNGGSGGSGASGGSAAGGSGGAGPGGCASGSYDDDGDPTTACVPWTACDPGQYVSTAGTATSDQVCAGCASGTFSTAADAADCVAWTTCPAGSFVTTKGSATSDQTCAPCAPGTYTTDANQSKCVTAADCPPGTVQTAPATATAAAVCKACAAGEYCAGGDVPPSACGGGTWDHDADPSTACVDRTVCAAGSAVTSEGNATTDRECAACAAGSFSATENAASCTPWTTCAAGTYVSSAGSATADRTCAACGSGTYSAAENASACTAWSTCAAGTYVSTPGSDSSDRVCTACPADTYTSGFNQSACVAVGACAPGTIQTAPGTATSPPTCTACTAGEYCAGATAPAVPCGAGAGTWDDDADPATACVARTTCSAGTYVSSAGSATSDRTCTACAAGTYSTTSNAASCTAWTTCAAGTYVSSAGSATSDQTCTACAAGEYSATSNAASCTAWTTCAAGTYASNTPSATTDRMCTTCTAIANCASGLSCTSASDQTCGTCAAGYALLSGGTVCGLPWTSEFGTTSDDEGYSVAVDGSGNVYVAGYTGGALYGATADAFVRKYSSAGAVLWTRQFGTASDDYAYSVAADGSGDVYVAGYTGGALAGANAGYSDAFVRKYSTAGAVVWTRQFGTASDDQADSVAVDGSGNVYVAGNTGGALEGASAGGADAFVRKYSSAGAALWTRQFGSATRDYGLSVAVAGSGDVYVGGYTDGALAGANAGNYDAFVRKYSSAGVALWTRQFGTASNDYEWAVAVDGSGDVYVAGATLGVLDGASVGNYDAFVRKYSSAGVALWTRQFGTALYDLGRSVAVDVTGNVYIAGYTTGALEGTNSGGSDVFVREYDSAGNVVWSGQSGTAGYDYGYGVAVDSSGLVYVAGYTSGTWPGQTNAGGADAFVTSFYP